MQNAQIVLKRRSVGVPREDDFALRTVARATPGPGEMSCATRYISLDPYLRGKISGRHLSGALAPGDVMAGEAVSVVLDSRADGFEAGDVVAAHSGWQTHPVVAARAARRIDPQLGPVSTALGVLGMPGLTAYAGLLRLGEPRAGDTVLVSAAAGPVGATVGQVARIHGARSVGIAGTDAKCAWLIEQAGFAAAINYKTEDLRAGIERTCPDGVDLYFDNVGGDVLQAAMERLARGARVVLCGLMAQYNRDDMPPGPNPAWIIKARATVRGLVVYDHEDLRPVFERDVSGWIAAGQFAYKEDLTGGLADAPAAFCRLMRGENFGKALVEIPAPEE